MNWQYSVCIGNYSINSSKDDLLARIAAIFCRINTVMPFTRYSMYYKLFKFSINCFEVRSIVENSANFCGIFTFTPALKFMFLALRQCRIHVSLHLTARNSLLSGHCMWWLILSSVPRKSRDFVAESIKKPKYHLWLIILINE